MSFEFYRDQPSTTGGSSERVLIKNDTSSAINLLTTDNNGKLIFPSIPISAGGSWLHNTDSGRPNLIQRLNGDRFWFYNSEKGTIVVSESDKDFEPYDEEKDKDAFLFDFEKGTGERVQETEDTSDSGNLPDDDWAENELITVLYNADDLSYEGTRRPTTNKLINNTSEAIRLIRMDYDGISERNVLELQPGKSTVYDVGDGVSHKVVSKESGEILYSLYFTGMGTVSLRENGIRYKPYSDGDFELKHLEWPQLLFSSPQPEKFQLTAYESTIYSNIHGYGIPSASRALEINDGGSLLSASYANNHDQLNLLDAHHAWAAGFTGKGVIVAVIDGGFHPHDELNFEFSLDLDSGQPNVTPEDGYYHGNGVASAIAAKYEPDKQGPDITGIAPDVSLMAIDITRIGGQSIPNAFTQGIRYAVNNGANIIQISWGNTGDTYSPDLASAVQYAYDNDVLVVWSAMNNAYYGLEGMSKTAELGIAIAGGNLRQEAMAPYENSNLAGDSIYPFFMVPSGDNYVPTEGASYYSAYNGGTSYASPLISGIAALLYQQNPNITVDEVIKKLALSSWQPSLGKNAEINELGQQILTPQTIGTASLRSPITDVLQFDTTKSEISPAIVSRSSGLTTVDGKSISLVDVERLQFTDAKIAFDTDGKAGDALQLLYAVSKDQYLSNDGVKGLAIELLDKAADRNEIVDYVMGVLARSFLGLQ
jgi:subtilisin family serine protease